MRIFGLTGGSGTGKSTVSALLQAQGAGAVDADAIYRGLCTSSGPMLQALRAAFGEQIVQHGILQRAALAKIVFSDPEKLQALNTLTLPYIRQASLAALQALSAHEIVLYDAPTLFETGAEDLCQAVIGVLAPYPDRLNRIMQRDGLTEEAARARLDAQPSDAFYRARCAYIIENHGTISALERDVLQLYQHLRKE